MLFCFGLLNICIRRKGERISLLIVMQPWAAKLKQTVRPKYKYLFLSKWQKLCCITVYSFKNLGWLCTWIGNIFFPSHTYECGCAWLFVMLRKFVEREEVLEFLRQGQNATCVRPETLVTQLRHKKRNEKISNKINLLCLLHFGSIPCESTKK